MTVLVSILTAFALNGPIAPTKYVAPPDSIGQEMRGGQRFVKHRVGSGETLFAIARRYHVTVAQLTAANPQLKNGLGIGEIIFVPRPAPGASKAPAAPAAGGTVKATYNPKGAAPTTYTVAKGESLFAIARRFQLKPADIIALNKLPADGAVRVGQKLILSNATEAVAAAKTVATAPDKPAISSPADAAPEPTTPPIDPAKPAQVATVTPATPADKIAEKEAQKQEAERKIEAEKEDRAPTRASEVVNRITESGTGASIEKSTTDKYLALHKTAPVGTIMQVKNAGNGQSVYVRVIGKLPDTGENSNILVRLSPRAVQKLGTSDARFRVETSYVP